MKLVLLLYLFYWLADQGANRTTSRLGQEIDAIGSKGPIQIGTNDTKVNAHQSIFNVDLEDFIHPTQFQNNICPRGIAIPDKSVPAP